MAAENRPNSLWPIKTKVTFCDAYGRNPFAGTIVRHYGETNVLVEDVKGVVHFGATWRISTKPPPKMAPVDLDDLLETPPPKPSRVDLDDLLV